MATINQSTSDDNNSIGRRLRTWRRLMLAFGPRSAKHVGIALSEFAWPEGGDPDGELVVRHCTQKILCRLCDYKDGRGLRRQLRVLENAGWIARDDMPTGPRLHREYLLLVPTVIRDDAISELSSPSRGMWRRVLDGKSEETAEPEAPCSESATNDTEQKHRTLSSGDIENTGTPRQNTGTEWQEQGNADSPLKKIVSSNQVVRSSERGTRQARARSIGKDNEHEKARKVLKLAELESQSVESIANSLHCSREFVIEVLRRDTA